MALATFTGPISDFGLNTISTTGLSVLFIPNDTGTTSAGRMMPKNPIPATISGGNYTVQLMSTDDIFPIGAYYSLRIQQLGVILFDQPDWKLHAPAGGGSLLDMLAPPTMDRPFSELDARYVRRGEIAGIVSAAVSAALAGSPSFAEAARAAVEAALADVALVYGEDVPDLDLYMGMADAAGNLLPFGVMPSGRLSTHSRQIIGEDAAGMFAIDDLDYALVAADDAGNVAFRVAHDGTFTAPGLAGGAGGGSTAPSGASYLITVRDGNVHSQNLSTGINRQVTNGLTITGTPEIVGSAVTFTAGGVLSWAPLDGGTVYPALARRDRWAWFGSSTMGGVSGRYAILAAQYGATSYVGGEGGQSSEHILARYGSRPAIVAAFTIPAAATPVNIVLRNVPTHSSTFQLGTTIAGIPGVINKASGNTASYTFTRTTAGTSAGVDEGTVAPATQGNNERGSLLILNLAKNNITGVSGTSDLDALITWSHEAYAYATSLSKNVLMVGHFVDTNTTATDPVRGQIQQYNNALRDRYGARFLDLDGMVTDPGLWSRIGIAATATDLAQQAIGNKPPSLSSDDLHLNDAGYDLMRDTTHAKLTALGWI